MESINGYCVQKAVTFENGHGFALADGTIWQFSEMSDGQRLYYGQRHCSGIIPHMEEFERLLSGYRCIYKVLEKGKSPMDGTRYYRYYSTQRPVDIGMFPRTGSLQPLEVVNYGSRCPVEGSSMQAWGEVVYTQPLTQKQIDDYELKPQPLTGAKGSCGKK